LETLSARSREKPKERSQERQMVMMMAVKRWRESMGGDPLCEEQTHDGALIGKEMATAKLCCFNGKGLEKATGYPLLAYSTRYYRYYPI
jgi:hypothetical protein